MIRKKKEKRDLVKEQKEVINAEIHKFKTGEEKQIDNQFEVIGELPKVKSGLSNITTDYVYAILNKAEKEFITENYENAEYAEEIIKRFGEKGYTFKWNETKGEWYTDKDGNPERFPLTDDEKKLIELRAGRIFKFFMIKPHLIALLNRNRWDNFLIKLLGKAPEEEQPVGFGPDDRSMIQKAMDKISGVEYEEEER